MFRGVIVKCWVMENINSVNFHPHNKVLIAHFVKYYYECWKIRCVVLRSREVQKKALKEDVLEIIEERSENEVVGLRRHAEAHKMKENNGIIAQMVSWVISVRVIKKIVTKSENQDIRNMMNARVN